VADIDLGAGVDHQISVSLAACGVPFVLTTGYDRSALDSRFEAAPHVTGPIAKQQLLRALPALF
jgi:hypothetical protein